MIGGRLYHLATSWNEVPRHWWGPFAIWKGGLGIWGGIAAGTLAGLLVLRRRHANIPAFLDAAAPGLLIAQAIGRLGNYFNQELFGGPTSLPWGLRIDVAHRPAGYEHYATFHPTFLYELVWDVALAGALIWLGRRKSIQPPGLFALYIAGYSLARIGEELVRVDPAHRVFGLRLNFYVASMLLVAGLAWFARIQQCRGRDAVRRGGALLAAGGLLCLVGCSHHSSPPRTILSASRLIAPTGQSVDSRMRLLEPIGFTGSQRDHHWARSRTPEVRPSAELPGPTSARSPRNHASHRLARPLTRATPRPSGGSSRRSVGRSARSCA